MNEQQKTYIAGTGMMTSIGGNTAMTAAAVKADINRYQASRYFNQQQQPITLSKVPDDVYNFIDIEIDEGNYYSIQYDHIIKMAVFALREAISEQPIKHPIPLVLAMPEERESEYYIPPELLMANLLKQKDLPLKADSLRFMSTGRAAGIQGLELVNHYLYEQGEPYVLLGGSESYWNAARLDKLDETERLLAPNRMDGFAAGEGAAFVLLTRHSTHALSHNHHIIMLSQPGISQEPGHYYSDKIYKGDGLDQAFKGALSDYTGEGVNTIYSSMNGESHWAKEQGVAIMRNKAFLKDSVKIEHPADCLGDLGVATGTLLIGLAAKSMWQQPDISTNLVYSSSDGAWRAAVRMEKINNIDNVKRSL